jgi:hypothetical protein
MNRLLQTITLAGLFAVGSTAAMACDDAGYTRSDKGAGVTAPSTVKAMNVTPADKQPQRAPAAKQSKPASIASEGSNSSAVPSGPIQPARVARGAASSGG